MKPQNSVVVCCYIEVFCQKVASEFKWGKGTHSTATAAPLAAPSLVHEAYINVSNLWETCFLSGL